MRSVLTTLLSCLVFSLVMIPTSQLLWSASRSTPHQATVSDGEPTPGGSRTLTTLPAGRPPTPASVVLARVPDLDVPGAPQAFAVEPFVPPRV